MQKLKPLIPTLRDKRRYVVFKVTTKFKPTFKQVSESINDSLKELIGTLGCAGAGIKILNEKWDLKNKIGIIMVNNKYVNELKMALAMINKINNKTANIQSLGVSGILKKTKRFIEVN